MKIIEVKTHPKYLASAIKGEKTFTVRKNDHDYEVGGVIRKMGYTPDKGYTGEYADFKITYILTHADFPDGIKEWYIVCGTKLISREKGVRKMNENKEVATEARECVCKAQEQLPEAYLRILDEKWELDNRIKKLNAFLSDNERTQRIGYQHLELLRRQLDIMLEYSSILNARILRWQF